MNPQIENLLRDLERAIEALVENVDSFPDESKEEKYFDKWSLKDLLAHFSGWNILTAAELKKLSEGRGNEVDWLSNDLLDQFNKEQVSKRKEMSWDTVYQEFIESADILLNQYKSLPEPAWKKQFGPKQESTALKSIEIDIKHHSADHLPEIKRVISRLS